MNIPDLLGWLGNIGFLIGAIYIAKKDIKTLWQRSIVKLKRL